MQDREKAALTITRCITALLSLRKQIGKSFREATKEDIRGILKWMDEEKHYRASTNEKFRQVLKLFYKVAYGNGESYPEQVKFFPVKVGKEKHAGSPELDTREYLDEDEVIKLIESAPTLQKKAFIACMYESTARPEEVLRLTNNDFLIDSNGVVLFLRGKTGERRVRIIAYAKLFQQWLDIHPLKYLKNYSIWISEASNYKNKPLGLRGAEKAIQVLMQKVLPAKHARLYILRHSRATHLANHFTESQLCQHFGWIQGSRVVRRYIHLTGKDIDRVLISLNNSGNASQFVEEYKIKPTRCARCKEGIPPGNTFCGKCSLPVNLSEQYTKETSVEEKNRLLELKIDALENNMNEKLSRLMSVIQQNPKLAMVKPEVLMKKIQHV
jgi:integrase